MWTTSVEFVATSRGVTGLVETASFSASVNVTPDAFRVGDAAAAAAGACADCAGLECEQPMKRLVVDNFQGAF